MNEPDTPVEVYKAIIDELVKDSRQSSSAARVAQHATYPGSPEHSELNEFIGSLSPQQRVLLGQMLQDDRENTIFDVLATLTWWITVRDVGLTFQGQPMPVELSGMGLHGDFIGRLGGWEWPSDEPDPAASFTVRDLKASLAWYQDVLGFTVEHEYERDGKQVAVLNTGSVQILIAQDDGSRNENRIRREGITMQISTTRNIDEISNRIKEHGGTLESDPVDTPWGTRVFRVQDPDGFKLTIASEK